MSTATAVQLICPDCRHENESERIFCHECGAKLDRSTVAARKHPKPEAPEQMHKRLQNMFSQRRAKARALAMNFVKLIAAACAAALVAEMFIAPELPPAKNGFVLPPPIGLDLESLTQYRKPLFLRYGDTEVNAYLANVLKTKTQKLDHPLFKFGRAVLGFTENNLRVTIERSIFGFSVYTSADYVVKAEGGKVNVSARGGSIGRLPIHPQLMQQASILFADLPAAMDREKKLVARIGSIQLHDHEVVLTSPQ